MEHVVFFTEPTGAPAFRRVGDLDGAVRLVESLRNEHGITDVTLHALIPVPVSFRAYYRVEVGGVEVGGVEAGTEANGPDEAGTDEADDSYALADVPELDALPADEPMVPLVRPEPEAERSLGYFAH